jgi:hypothetical protein
MLTQSTAQLATPCTIPDLDRAQRADGSWLVLERLPSGEWAWLREDLDAAIDAADQLDRRASRLLGDERVDLTDAGRRALAVDALFGDHWPTVAEVA